MSKIPGWLLSLAMLLGMEAAAQKMPSDYFKEGCAAMDALKTQQALACFRHIIDHNPHNALYAKSYYNLGIIYYQDKQYDSALMVFGHILHGNFDEQESSGGGLMDDPYTNYRHRSAELISTMHFNRKHFDTALYYFSLADTAFPYLHFCGNELEANEVHKALRYAAIYQKLHQNDQAIRKLLPMVFARLSDNSQIIARLKTLLQDKKPVKQELDKALTRIHTETVHYGKQSYERYYFTFLNTDIELPRDYGWNSDNYDEAKSVAMVKVSAFYKMVSGL